MIDAGMILSGDHIEYNRLKESFRTIDSRYYHQPSYWLIGLCQVEVEKPDAFNIETRRPSSVAKTQN